MLKLILVTFLYAITMQPMIVIATADQDRWLNRNKEGWFFYNEQEDPEPEIKIEKEVPPTPTPPPVAKPELPQEEGPEPFSSAWIRGNIQFYLDAAIDNPTAENVSAYLYIQNYAMNKSMQFMDANKKATLGHPMFDSISQRPTATYANRQLDEEATQKRAETLDHISHNSGIFFFSDNSNASKIQADIISMLVRNFDFDILKITTAQPTQELADQGFKEDKGRSKTLGISTYPAIALISADGNYDVISQAPVSYSDLRDRLLIGANRLGVINEAELNQTRPIRNLGSINVDITQLKNSSSDTSSVPVPQKDIVNLFNQR